MAVLVTGGAGYIGSFCCAALSAAGQDFVVLDDLSTGHREAIPGAKLYVGSIADSMLLHRIFTDERIDSVIHFAGSSLVGESFSLPGKYFRNNVAGTLTLLESMAGHDVKHIVFSSSAAVYGEPDAIPIPETAPTAPINPYGDSKLMIEVMLRRFSVSAGLRYVALRYFNVAGAAADGTRGEDHRPETHLIPLLLTALQSGKEFNLFGDDYPTRDGSCIRDYVHVEDLIDAHILALDYLKGGGENAVFNLGSGDGFSVFEILHAAQELLGVKARLNIAGRRAGDPAVLVASSRSAREVLNWNPGKTDVETILKTAHAWHKAQPEGYGG